MKTCCETMQNLLEIVLKSKLVGHKSWYQSTLITEGYSCLEFTKVFSTCYSIEKSVHTYNLNAFSKDHIGNGVYNYYQVNHIGPKIFKKI